MVDNTDLIEEAEAERGVQETEADRLREQELGDVWAVMQTEHGRRFIWRILFEAGMYHDPQTFDTNQAFFQMGRRSMGLLVMVDAEAMDDLFVLMRNEAAAEEQTLEKEALSNGTD